MPKLLAHSPDDPFSAMCVVGAQHVVTGTVRGCVCVWSISESVEACEEASNFQPLLLVCENEEADAVTCIDYDQVPDTLTCVFGSRHSLSWPFSQLLRDGPMCQAEKFTFPRNVTEASRQTSHVALCRSLCVVLTQGQDWSHVMNLKIQTDHKPNIPSSRTTVPTHLVTANYVRESGEGRDTRRRRKREASDVARQERADEEHKGKDDGRIEDTRAHASGSHFGNGSSDPEGNSQTMGVEATEEGRAMEGASAQGLASRGRGTHRHVSTDAGMDMAGRPPRSDNAGKEESWDMQELMQILSSMGLEESMQRLLGRNLEGQGQRAGVLRLLAEGAATEQEAQAELRQLGLTVGARKRLLTAAMRMTQAKVAVRPGSGGVGVGLAGGIDDQDGGGRGDRGAEGGAGGLGVGVAVQGVSGESVSQAAHDVDREPRLEALAGTEAAVEGERAAGGEAMIEGMGQGTASESEECVGRKQGAVAAQIPGRVLFSEATSRAPHVRAPLRATSLEPIEDISAVAALPGACVPARNSPAVLRVASPMSPTPPAGSKDLACGAGSLGSYALLLTVTSRCEAESEAAKGQGKGKGVKQVQVWSAADEAIESEAWDRIFSADLPALTDARLWGPAHELLACSVGSCVQIYPWRAAIESYASSPAPCPPATHGEEGGVPGTDDAPAARPKLAIAPAPAPAGKDDEALERARADGTQRLLVDAAGAAAHGGARSEDGSTAAGVERQGAQDGGGAEGAKQRKMGSSLRLVGHRCQIVAFDVASGGDRCVTVDERFEVRFWERERCVRVVHCEQLWPSPPACCCCFFFCCVDIFSFARCLASSILPSALGRWSRALRRRFRGRWAQFPCAGVEDREVGLLARDVFSYHYSGDLSSVRLVGSTGAVLSTGCELWLILPEESPPGRV